MKTNIHLWYYLAQFFIEWEMFQTKVIKKIKTHILCSITFYRKSYRLWDNVEKYCRAGQTTDDMMRAHCSWTHKATNTLSEYVILITLPLQHGSTKASQCYVIPILRLLLWYIHYLAQDLEMFSGIFARKHVLFRKIFNDVLLVADM